MANMLDYLDWRGDLTLAQDPFNEVDSLVLCQLSYCDLKGIVPAPGERGSVSVATAARRFDEAHAQEATAPDAVGGFSPLTPEPLRRMAASRRFRHATLSRYDERLDDEMGEQFAAICVRLDDKSTYVAFRGTDDTFTGWREDFSMSFTVVGSQERALAYLEAVRRSVRGPLRVGGHSKGGNLAVFAAARSGWATQRRIVDVWCHDGPGFVDSTLDVRALEAIEPRIHRFVPEFCVVGQMLGLRGKPAVVASATSAIMQHSALNWQVMGNRFVRRPAIDEGALRFGKVFNEAVSSHDPAWRQRFTDAFFAALSAAARPRRRCSRGHRARTCASPGPTRTWSRTSGRPPTRCWGRSLASRSQRRWRRRVGPWARPWRAFWARAAQARTGARSRSAGRPSGR